MKQKTVRIPTTFSLSQAEREILDRINEETGISKSEIMRRGLKLFAASVKRGES